MYALINYMILSRVLYYVPYLAPLHPGRVTTTFVGLDGVCEILIGQGAWRMANSSMTASQRKVGEHLVTASLSLQAALFGAFGVLAAHFNVRARKANVLSRRIQTVLNVLYVSATIITIRCIYRLVEYVAGWESTVYRNEAFFWVFEASIMLVNTVMLNVWFPGRRLPRSNRVFLARDGVTERRGPGWADNRPWVLTLFDPFDVVGLAMGRDKKTQFWDMTDEQLAQLEHEQKTNKRSVLASLVDPLHLWGRRGYFGKDLHCWREARGEGPASEGVQVKEQSGEVKGPGAGV